MSAVATSARPVLVTHPPATEHAAPRLFDAGEVTLEDLVLGTWEDLVRDGRAACPVCGGRIARDAGCGCGAELD